MGRAPVPLMLPEWTMAERKAETGVSDHEQRIEALLSREPERKIAAMTILLASHGSHEHTCDIMTPSSKRASCKPPSCTCGWDAVCEVLF